MRHDNVTLEFKNKTKTDSARLRIAIEVYELEKPEFVGDSTWSFERKDVMAFAEDKSDAKTNAIDNEEDETIQVSIPDEAIIILNGMMQWGGTFEIGYVASRSSYWAFHDIIHAREDVENGKLEAIEQWREDRALINGAILAIQHNQPFAEILRELVSVESIEGSLSYSARFDCEAPDFLERFLQNVKAEIVL